MMSSYWGKYEKTSHRFAHEGETKNAPFQRCHPRELAVAMPRGPPWRACHPSDLPRALEPVPLFLPRRFLPPRLRLPPTCRRSLGETGLSIFPLSSFHTRFPSLLRHRARTRFYNGSLPPRAVCVVKIACCHWANRKKLMMGVEQKVKKKKKLHVQIINASTSTFILRVITTMKSVSNFSFRKTLLVHARRAR